MSRVEQFTENDPIIKKLLEGDSRCKIPLGATIEKVYSEEGDNHTIGTKGKVIGSAYIGDEDSNLEPKECYLVNFEGDNKFKVSFVLGEKIKEV